MVLPMAFFEVPGVSAKVPALTLLICENYGSFQPDGTKGGGWGLLINCKVGGYEGRVLWFPICCLLMIL